MKRGRPAQAGFRKTTIELEKSDRLEEYVIRRTEHGDVQIVGQPALTQAQQQNVFTALARDLARTQIFDDEAPAVAAALRDMLERR